MPANGRWDLTRRLKCLVHRTTQLKHRTTQLSNRTTQLSTLNNTIKYTEQHN